MLFMRRSIALGLLAALVGVQASNRAFVELIDGVCPRRPTSTIPGGGGGTTTPPGTTPTLPPTNQFCAKSAFKHPICGQFGDGFSYWFGHDEYVLMFEEGTSLFSWDDNGANGEGTATLTGWLSNPDRPEWGRWWADIRAYQKTTQDDPNPAFPPSSAGFKLELKGECYEPTGPVTPHVDVDDFILYVDWKGWLVEYDGYDPLDPSAPLSLSGRSFTNTERGPPLMIGYGGNNKNLEYGMSFWIRWIASPLDGYSPSFPLPNWDLGSFGKGDMNIDLYVCTPDANIWRPSYLDYCDLVVGWQDTPWLPACPGLLESQQQLLAAEEADSEAGVKMLATCDNSVDNLVIDGDAILEVGPSLSGFRTKDNIHLYVAVPSKYETVDITLGLAPDKEFLINNIPNGVPCYDRYIISAKWGDYVNGGGELAVEEIEDNGNRYRQFTGSVHVTMTETLNDIRGTAPPRVIISELPFIVRFPLQVTAVVDSINVFYCVNVAAAIIRQEVEVNLDQLADAQGYLRIFTSTQWPFKLQSPIISGANDAVTNKFEKIDMGLVEDCPDPTVGPVIPGATPDDSLACNQIWMVHLNPKSTTCTLDGDYTAEFTSICQPSFITGTNNCPINPPWDDYVAFNFRLDSEDFCPKVVDNVDLAGAVGVYKDALRTVDATNFILDQTAYFELTATSNKVSVVSVSITELSIITPSDPGVHKILWTQATGANPLVPIAGLQVNNHDSSGPHSIAWWQFQITDSALFNPPADGSIDFSVYVSADVVFKGNEPLLLGGSSESKVQLLNLAFLPATSSKSQELRREVQSSLSAREGDPAASASSNAGAALALASLLVAGQM